ncbi:MAG: hypothetical protein E6J42_11425 [Chloroflexi bacterium]|nr:MAG: hypothetical protein E6J42_11425 [Chloroflexota bacterium]
MSLGDLLLLGRLSFASGHPHQVGAQAAARRPSAQQKEARITKAKPQQDPEEEARAAGHASGRSP